MVDVKLGKLSGTSFERWVGMKINNVIISEEKLAKLISVLPEDVLVEEYIKAGLCDIEISEKYGLTDKLPKRYRSKDNQQPSFGGNPIEGSTTEGSLIPSFGYGDKTYLDEVICQDMPSTCI